MTPVARRFLVPGLLAGETRAEDLAPDVAAVVARGAGPLVGRLASRAAAANGRPAPASSEKLLTPQEAAARLGVEVTWIYRHATKLGAQKLSRKVMRISEAALSKYLAKKER